MEYKEVIFQVQFKKIFLILISLMCLNLITINTFAYDYSDMADQNDYYSTSFNVNGISYGYPIGNSPLNEYGYPVESTASTATVFNLNSKSSVITIPDTVEYNGKTYTVKYLTFYPWINSVPLCLGTCEELNIPDTMVYWNDSLDGDSYSSYKWKRLKTVNISENSKLVEIYGFFDCPNLKSVYIPKSVTNLGFSFTNCPNLKMTISKENPKYKMRNTRYLCSRNGKKVYRYFGKQKNIIIPKGVKTLGGSGFWDNRYIKKLTVPKSLKTIEYYAFKNCKSLSKVVINNKKKSPKIEKNAFKNTKKGIKFYVKNKKVAKSLKKQLKGSGVKKAKILVSKKVIYKNVK